MPKTEIAFDGDAKRHIQRLTAAIDALAKAINSGEKVDKDSISEPVVQRLVEDSLKRARLNEYAPEDGVYDFHNYYKGRRTSDAQPQPDDAERRMNNVGYTNSGANFGRRVALVDPGTTYSIDDHVAELSRKIAQVDATDDSYYRDADGRLQRDRRLRP